MENYNLLLEKLKGETPTYTKDLDQLVKILIEPNDKINKLIARDLRVILPNIIVWATCSDDAIRSCVLPVYGTLTKILDVKSTFKTENWWKDLETNVVPNKFCPQMLKLLASNKADWVPSWIFVANLMVNDVHVNGAALNSLLKIVEIAFKMSRKNAEMVDQAFVCWMKLIEIFSLHPRVMHSKKLVGLLVKPLATPLQPKAAKLKIKTWQLLVEKIGTLHENCATTIVHPFIDYMYGKGEESMAKAHPEDCFNSLLSLISYKGIRHQYSLKIVSSFSVCIDCGLSLPSIENLFDAITDLLNSVKEEEQESHLNEFLNQIQKCITKANPDVAINQILVSKFVKFVVKQNMEKLLESNVVSPKMMALMLDSVEFRKNAYNSYVDSFVQKHSDKDEISEIEKREIMGVWDNFSGGVTEWLSQTTLSKVTLDDQKMMFSVLVFPLSDALWSGASFRSWSTYYEALEKAKLLNTNKLNAHILEMFKSSKLSVTAVLEIFLFMGNKDKNALKDTIPALELAVAQIGPKDWKQALDLLTLVESLVGVVSKKDVFHILNEVNKAVNQFEQLHQHKIRTKSTRLHRKLMSVAETIETDKKDVEKVTPESNKQSKVRTPFVSQSNFLQRLAKQEEKKKVKSPLSSMFSPQNEKGSSEENLEDSILDEQKTKPNIVENGHVQPEETEENLKNILQESQEKKLDMPNPTANIKDQIDKPVSDVEKENDISHLKLSNGLPAPTIITPNKLRITTTQSPQLKNSGSPSTPSLRRSPKVQAGLKNASAKKPTPSKCTYFDDDASDFIMVPPKPKVSVLTDHQKEMMSKRRTDIPALYQDLSQDTQSSQNNSSSLIIPEVKIVPPTPIPVSNAIQEGNTSVEDIILSTPLKEESSMVTPVKHGSQSSAKKLNFDSMSPKPSPQSTPVSRRTTRHSVVQEREKSPDLTVSEKRTRGRLSLATKKENSPERLGFHSIQENENSNVLTVSEKRKRGRPSLATKKENSPEKLGSHSSQENENSNVLTVSEKRTRGRPSLASKNGNTPEISTRTERASTTKKEAIKPTENKYENSEASESPFKSEISKFNSKEEVKSEIIKSNSKEEKASLKEPQDPHVDKIKETLNSRKQNSPDPGKDKDLNINCENKIKETSGEMKFKESTSENKLKETDDEKKSKEQSSVNEKMDVLEHDKVTDGRKTKIQDQESEIIENKTEDNDTNKDQLKLKSTESNNTNISEKAEKPEEIEVMEVTEDKKEMSKDDQSKEEKGDEIAPKKGRKRKSEPIKLSPKQLRSKKLSLPQKPYKKTRAPKPNTDSFSSEENSPVTTISEVNVMPLVEETIENSTAETKKPVSPSLAEKTQENSLEKVANKIETDKNETPSAPILEKEDTEEEKKVTKADGQDISNKRKRKTSESPTTPQIELKKPRIDSDVETPVSNVRKKMVNRPGRRKRFLKPIANTSSGSNLEHWLLRTDKITVKPIIVDQIKTEPDNDNEFPSIVVDDGEGIRNILIPNDTISSIDEISHAGEINFDDSVIVESPDEAEGVIESNQETLCLNDRLNKKLSESEANGNSNSCDRLAVSRGVKLLSSVLEDDKTAKFYLASTVDPSKKVNGSPSLNGGSPVSGRTAHMLRLATNKSVNLTPTRRKSIVPPVRYGENWPKGPKEDWIACMPTPPGKSPRRSVLKVRLESPALTDPPTSPSTKDEFQFESTTPCSTQKTKKRVSFLEPCVSKGLVYNEETNEGEIHVPDLPHRRNPYWVGGHFETIVIKEEPVDDYESHDAPTIDDQNSELEVLSDVSVIVESPESPIRKTLPNGKKIKSEDDVVISQDLFAERSSTTTINEKDDDYDLNKLSSLKNCLEPLAEVFSDLPNWDFLENVLMKLGVMRVGELAFLNAATINSLPFEEPKRKTLYSLLKTFLERVNEKDKATEVAFTNSENRLTPSPVQVSEVSVQCNAETADHSTQHSPALSAKGTQFTGLTKNSSTQSSSPTLKESFVQTENNLAEQKWTLEEVRLVMKNKTFTENLASLFDYDMLASLVRLKDEAQQK